MSTHLFRELASLVECRTDKEVRLRKVLVGANAPVDDAVLAAQRDQELRDLLRTAPPGASQNWQQAIGSYLAPSACGALHDWQSGVRASFRP